MTDQLRKAALEFLRLAIEAPKDHGHYAIDGNGEVYWYEERPFPSSSGSDFWATKHGANIPTEMQKILLWDSLLFSAEEVASTPIEPPQPEPAPSPKMGPFDMERFRNGELSYTEKGTTHRYLGVLSGKSYIACAVAPYDDPSREIMVERLACELEQHTKMPVKTKKVYVHLWKYDNGHFSSYCDNRILYNLGHRNEECLKTLIEIIEREVEV